MPERETGAIVVVDDRQHETGRRADAECGGISCRDLRLGREPARVHAAQSAGCLVVDIRLPGLSGFELFRELARISVKRLPVIFMTGHDTRRAQPGQCARRVRLHAEAVPWPNARRGGSQGGRQGQMTTESAPPGDTPPPPSSPLSPGGCPMNRSKICTGTGAPRW